MFKICTICQFRHFLKIYIIARLAKINEKNSDRIVNFGPNNHTKLS